MESVAFTKEMQKCTKITAVYMCLHNVSAQCTYQKEVFSSLTLDDQVLKQMHHHDFFNKNLCAPFGTRFTHIQ
jgi:hypothetical protein